jgi:ribose-phosphate pyrophosphokinase
LKHNKKYHTAIIIDDIVSTGGTMIEAIKHVKPLAKNICCIAVHGIFDMNSLAKLEKLAKIVSTNTIPSKVSKIDMTGIVAGAIIN